MEDDELIAKARFHDDLGRSRPRAGGKFEMEFARGVVHPERREQGEMMIDRVDKPHLRGNELVVAQLPERLAADTSA